MSKLALWLSRNANKIYRHLEVYVTPVTNDYAGRRRCTCRNRFKATYAHILNSLTVNTGISHPGFKTEGETEHHAGPQWVHR